MPNIDVSNDGLVRLVNRLTREYGEAAAANFALDEQLAAVAAQHVGFVEQITAKDEMLTSLRAQIEAMGKEIDTMRLAADPENPHRYMRATRKPKRVSA